MQCWCITLYSVFTPGLSFFSTCVDGVDELLSRLAGGKQPAGPTPNFWGQKENFITPPNLKPEPPPPN